MPADPRRLCVKCQPRPRLATRAANKKQNQTGAIRPYYRAPGRVLPHRECVVSFAGWAWLRWDLSQGCQGLGGVPAAPPLQVKPPHALINAAASLHRCRASSPACAALCLTAV